MLQHFRWNLEKCLGIWCLIERCRTMLGLNHSDQMNLDCSVTRKQKNANITVAVEGNIGSGKSTLLKFFRKNPLVQVFEEPVAEWQNVGGKNLLDLFYTDCERWSYLFESYAVLSLMKVHQKPHITPVKMIERSVYSGFYCFEQNLFESGLMSRAEHAVHSKWFNWITKQQKPQLDLIIYLRTSPEVCMERIRARCRAEEETLPMDLLVALHRQHEEWLMKGKFPIPAPVMVIDGNRNLEEMLTFYQDNDQYLLGLKMWPPQLPQQAAC